VKKKIRAVQYGVGPIGAAIVRLMWEKESIEIIGAIDSDPSKAGRVVSPREGSLQDQRRRKCHDECTEPSLLTQNREVVDRRFDAFPASLDALRLLPSQDLAPKKGVIIGDNLVMQGANALRDAVCQTGALQNISNRIAPRGLEEGRFA